MLIEQVAAQELPCRSLIGKVAVGGSGGSRVESLHCMDVVSAFVKRRDSKERFPWELQRRAFPSDLPRLTMSATLIWVFLGANFPLQGMSQSSTTLV